MRRGQLRKLLVSRVIQVFFLWPGQPVATHALRVMPALQPPAKSRALLVGTQHQGHWSAFRATQGLGPALRAVRAPRAQLVQFLQKVPQFVRHVLLDMRVFLR